jgi:hypothetical protein
MRTPEEKEKIIDDYLIQEKVLWNLNENQE